MTNLSSFRGFKASQEIILQMIPAVVPLPLTSFQPVSKRQPHLLPPSFPRQKAKIIEADC
jgi:hypothetical protein